jgi:carboxylate-amine ligase
VSELSATTSHWAEWRPHASGTDFTVGVEEEVMLLHPHDWSLAQQIDRVLPALPRDLAAHVTPETHKSALELATGVHGRVGDAAAEIAALRASLESHLSVLGLRAAAAGTHPFTVWHETVVSSDGRYKLVYGSMRELARREPTFALHVHVGVSDPETAINLVNRLRAHLPLLLALSANSPFWQGRDTGLASARTPLFQAFPRVGIPRAFDSYSEYVEIVDLLISSGAFPEPTFLWWDVRPQPRFGTVEVRIMDAQTSVEDSAALVALVQSLARLECQDGFACERLISAPEVLDENRFVAARDGVEAELIEPRVGRRVPLRAQVGEVVEACIPHARALGCEAELEHVTALVEQPPASRQVLRARGPARLPGLVRLLADEFTA